MSELERMLAETYGAGYRDPRLDADSVLYAGAERRPDYADVDTAHLLARMPRTSPTTRAMRSIADAIPAYDDPQMKRGPQEDWLSWWTRTNQDSSLPNFLAHLGKGALNTSANWLDGRPEVGADTLAPLGAGLGVSAASRAAVPRPNISPADWARAKWIERQLDIMEEAGQPSWDRGITGGTNPNSPYVVPRSAEALVRNNGIPAAAVPGNIVPIGVRHPANDLFADSSRASLPGTIVNAAEQTSKPTAGTTPRSPRQEALERGRADFYEPQNPFGAMANYLEGGLGNPRHDPEGLKRYVQGLLEFDGAGPPTRALSEDAKGRFYDRNKLNAAPGLPLPAQDRRDSLADLLAQYGGQF